MNIDDKRFVRMTSDLISGFKIATRKDINKNLADDEAFDEKLFMRTLIMLYGQPDLVVEGRQSYSINDTKNNSEFEVFIGNSGPSYGGYLNHFENIKEAIIKPVVIDTLVAFDSMLALMKK